MKGNESMTEQEQRQILIDTYVNLMRIKAQQKEENKELEYQIKVTKLKLSDMAIDYKDLEL